MSTSLEMAAAAQPSGQSLDHIQDSTLDTEMTRPLTTKDEGIDRTSLSGSISSEMSNSFQTARDRSERIEGHSGNVPRNNVNNSHTNSVVGGSWRRNDTTGQNGSAPSQFQQSNYDTGSQMSVQYDTTRQRGNSAVTSDFSVPLSSVAPGPVWPTEAQLHTAYGYGIQREDGEITRLIPADSLRENSRNFSTTQGPEGLILLPSPRQPSPSRRQVPEQMISSELVTQLPLNRPRRPRNPPRDDTDETQQTIDSIIAQNAMVSPPRRREKIYCDKWIHEGVCAFTQMGCKYKHEMPMDKATQISLGLNHGIPNWYRRAFSVQVSLPPPPSMVPNPPNSNRLSGNWRRSDGPASHGGSSNSYQSGPPGGVRTNFGPIGPPPSSSQLSGFANNNQYALLKVDQDEDDEADNDTVTYKGRGHH